MKKTIAEKRSYKVLTTEQATLISKQFFNNSKLKNIISFGLPEIDDRYHVWRVPLMNNESRIGELIINCFSAKIDTEKSTKIDFILNKFVNYKDYDNKEIKKNKEIKLSNITNTVVHGNNLDVLETIDDDCINLIFTSPPYYNAKPEYSEYSSYEEYLEYMRIIIRKCHRVLSEGRFFVINVSPVLLRRESRNKASKRIAVPFDLHRIFVEEGYDFIDDIHWEKPAGAGWALGRGRRFAADRTPLQYKPVPVTEYILVYRKKTEHLIDWNIRKHPDQDAILSSKINDDYEKTNIWKINPSRNKNHPATFPKELAKKVIQYYSFKNDIVLDPFAGSGTTGYAALDLDRKFYMIEINNNYTEYIITKLGKLLNDFIYKQI